MEERKKIEERKWFTPSEKKFIKSKSNGVCSHCGKPLSDDFTVEHVIPLSKGGSNDMTNIVALCSNCNTEKDSYIYHPMDYYKYLLPNYLDELIKGQAKYYSKFDWLNTNSLLPEDMREFKVDVLIKHDGLKSHKRKNQSVLVPAMTSSIFLKKAVYSDLDEIYKFYLKYAYKYIAPESLDGIEKTVKMEISDWFDNGAIYYLVDKMNEIKVVMPIKFCSYSDDYEKARAEASVQDGVVPTFETPIIIKEGVNYTVATIKAYTYILANLAKRLKTSVYYIMDSYRVNKSAVRANDAILYMSDCAIGIDSFNEDGLLRKSVFNGRWTYNDEALLDNVQSLDSIESYMKQESELKYIQKHTSFEHKQGLDDWFQLTEFDIPRYKEEMRIFARNLARQLGYRSKDSRIEIVSAINDTKAVVDESVYDVIELPIDKICLPDSVSGNVSIPSFIKKQVQMNCIKYIEIDGDYTVVPNDVPVLMYLKQLNRKTIKCSIKKKKVWQLTEDEFDVLDRELESFSEEDAKFIKGLYRMQKRNDNTYAKHSIVMNQGCRCFVCESKFSKENLPYTVLKVPRRLGGKSTDDNIIGACKTCRNLIGNLSYSEELKSLILKEYKLAEKMNCPIA